MLKIQRWFKFSVLLKIIQNPLKHFGMPAIVSSWSVKIYQLTPTTNSRDYFNHVQKRYPVSRGYNISYIIPRKIKFSDSSPLFENVTNFVFKKKKNSFYVMLQNNILSAKILFFPLVRNIPRKF